MLCSSEEFDNMDFTIDDYVRSKAAERHKRIYDSFRICPTYVETGSCPRRDSIDNPCPHRHSRGEKSIVCKHWLRGLCKKEEDCEFLHMYDMTKLPPCHFFSTFGKCNNPECLFLHLRYNLGIRVNTNTNANDIDNKDSNDNDIDMDTDKHKHKHKDKHKQNEYVNKIHRECQWYKHGYCMLGDKKCPNQHIKRIICPDWLQGCCMRGDLKCQFEHPRFELPTTKMVESYLRNPNLLRNQRARDHNRSMKSQHSSNNNNNNNMATDDMNNDMNDKNASGQMGGMTGGLGGGGGHSQKYGKKLRPLSDVTCYKCGLKGHYANSCPNK